MLTDDNRFIHVQVGGTILCDGEAIGYVERTMPMAKAMGEWRAEVGDPAKPETYRVCYAKTRKAAVRSVVA